MTTKKKLGIWMDHSDACLISLNNKSSEIKTISNPFNHAEKEEALSRSENLMHNKNQQQQAAYYKDLADTIVSYDEVILFGPTNAKTELMNIMQSDLRFEKIKFDVVPSDKMTDNQKKAFVKDHFSN